MQFAKNYKPEFDRTQIEEYPNTAPNKQLEALAIESGLYSRFNTDPKITRQNFEKIYKLWIYNSATRDNAKTVLIIKRDQKIVGMVTLGEKNDRGDIGLLAVDPSYRGMGLGKILVYAAQDWCVTQGYQTGQVVTQKTNIPAAKLYENCGYKVEKIENFYHFWL